MKPKNEKHQHICRIRITMYKAPQFHKEKLFPNEDAHDYYIDSLRAYVPLWQKYFGQAIAPNGYIWNRLRRYCQEDLLPSPDPWIQYTANELLDALAGAEHNFKKDCKESHAGPSDNWMSNWDLYCEDYYIKLYLED